MENQYQEQISLLTEELTKMQQNINQGKNQQDEDIRKKHEIEMKKITDEHQQSIKLLTKQNEILNKKVNDLQNLISSKTLELQKSKGTRRTSQLQVDGLYIQLAQKDMQIQELQSNLIETKQSFEILIEKAKQMDERNKQLKEKMVTASKQIKQEEDLEIDVSKMVVFDLVITNEVETLLSLVGKGWLFVKASAAPMKPFKRFIAIFSYGQECLQTFLVNYFKQEAIQNLLSQKVFILVENDSCYLVKVLNHVPQLMVTNYNDMFDHWDELWLELAINCCNTFIFLTESYSQDDEIINSIARLNPNNFIIVTSTDTQAKEIASVYHLPSQEDDYYSNNRIKVITQKSNQLNNLINRSKGETETLFLDIMKNFLVKNYQLFFEQSSEKASIKITKLLATNTFNYLLSIQKTQLNKSKIPILLNHSTPLFSVFTEDNEVKINLDVKHKKITSLNANIQTSFQYNFITFSLIKIVLYREESYENSYLLQVPYLLSKIKQINNMSIICQ